MKNQMKSMKRASVGVVATSAALCAVAVLTACGGSSTENNYGSTETANTITIRTVDEYGNPVNGRIMRNGIIVGTREVEINYSPGEDSTVTFDALTGYTVPSALDLAATPFVYGEIYAAAYSRTTPSANICPRAINAQGDVIDATVTVNGVQVDYRTGYCASVSVDREVDIASSGTTNTWYSPIYIPAGALEEGQTYSYDLLFGTNTTTIYVSTTPVQGEVFVDGRSVGWAKGHDALAVQITGTPDEPATTIISFGEVAGHETPESFSVDSSEVDYTDSKTQRFWGLYDSASHALVCFQGDNNGSPMTARVLVNDTNKLTGGWDYPACVGLDVNLDHTAEFLKSDNFQSTDVLTISQEEHVGCEGNFTAGSTLNCVGEYYYVQPSSERTEWYVEVNFTAPYQGNLEYPVSGRFEAEGVQHQQQNYSWTLGLSETLSVSFLPLGILTPSLPSIAIDTANLSEDDAAFDPSTGSWVYTISYQPPTGAVETCITSLNQNDENISTEVGMNFDGVDALNAWAEELDCHWFQPSGNHLIVPDWLNGYQPAVSQVYIPDGKVVGQANYELPFVPQPTQCQICIDGNPVEAALTLNGHHLGWTNLGQKCLWVDKTVANTLVIVGKGSRSWAADDPALASGYLGVNYADF